MNLALTCWFCQCCNTTILFYLLIIKPTLYNRIRLFISEWDAKTIASTVSETVDAIVFIQQPNRTSFESFEVEMTLNYHVHTWMENGSFMRNITSWSVPFWLVLLTEHKVVHCSAMIAVYRCLVARQLYPSCGYSSADCRCFQVSNLCRAIHLTAFVHHTALKDRDF